MGMGEWRTKFKEKYSKTLLIPLLGQYACIVLRTFIVLLSSCVQTDSPPEPMGTSTEIFSLIFLVKTSTKPNLVVPSLLTVSQIKKSNRAF